RLNYTPGIGRSAVGLGKEEVTVMPSHYGSPHNPMVVGIHGLAVQTLLRSVVLAGLGSLAVAPLVGVPRPADAAPVRHSGGIGTATASVVNFRGSQVPRRQNAGTG